jgi:Secretion system C-terminal sorting domain
LTIVKVFDLLGREVGSLVNEVKEPGTYTVEFDGSDLSSGVYFYKLQAGGFVQTHKMLLVR